MSELFGPRSSVEVSDGYITNQFLVTLRTSIVSEAGAMTIDAARSSAVDEDSFRGFQNRLEAAAHGAGVTLELERPVVEAQNVLSELERLGLIEDAVPVRRPRQNEEMISNLLPRGSGRAAAAAVESFSRAGNRPSDELLAGAVLITIPSSESAGLVLERLRSDPGQVAAVEPVPLRKLQHDLSPANLAPMAPWHLDRIGLHRARDGAGASFDDASGVRVAVLDTGIDSTHPLLEPQVDQYSYEPPLPGIASGRRDLIAHGTHVAGTIAAMGRPRDVEGVCRARLHIFKIFDDDIDSTRFLQRTGGGLVVIDEHCVNEVMYLRALAACVDNNYDVVNLSIGGPAIGHSREQAHFRRMVAQGQVVVAAMGNERREGSPISWPAAYPGVIAVGALDLNDGVAPFSNGGTHISVTAPGVDILATMPTYRGVEMWTGRRDSSGAIVRDQPIHWTVYRSTMRGTSMAAPQVAGAAALWIARHGRRLDDFREKLGTSARRVPLMGSVVSNADYGFGCLDVEALLQ